MASGKDDSTSEALPPYSEMVLDAIAELGEKDGSSKLAISRQIESTYGDSLPSDHNAVLTETLTKLKETGKLLFVKNNYLKPDIEETPRRGRGRPPKSNLDGVGTQSPKSRSVPAKEKGIDSASTGKKRGRPPKKSSLNDDSASPSAVASSTSVKRGRGRPPKESSSTAEGYSD